MKRNPARGKNRKDRKDRKDGAKRQRFKGRLARAPEKREEKKTSLPASSCVVGVVAKASFGWTLLPADRRDKTPYILRTPAKAEEKEGRLVAVRLLPSTKKGRQEVEILHDIGAADDPRTISLAAIKANEIPDRFPDEVLKEAAKWKTAPLLPSVTPAQAGVPFNSTEENKRDARFRGHDEARQSRDDLRDIPLVTIDGPDSRDFDDAVFAEKDGDGWHLLVAIADVAHYVRPASLLDQEAYKRGNSTYFPDTVVPMLPEALSNDLCSLVPNEDRLCLAAHLWLDAAGDIKRWRFVRGVMKSHARLTYEQVQAARDGAPDAATKPLVKKVIEPLYGAFACLMQARLKRGTLELDLPERKILLDKRGDVRAIAVRERLCAHRLIEEFMIAANVAAAAQLEGQQKKGKGGLCLYRIHDKPTELKLDALRDFLDSLGINLVPARQLHPRLLTQILENAAGGEHAAVINEVMLRSQSQAVYSPENIGHFGLALARYAHFTSPIRRYADLIVHRGLIRACGLGEDGLTEGEIERLEEIAAHISATERRSITAEREATDRFVARFLSGKAGAVFAARISGVARFGLFARLEETGADGIVPFHALPRDFYELDEKRHALVGKRSGRTYQLGAAVTVQLIEADALTGSLSLQIVEKEEERRPNASRRPSKARDSRRSRRNAANGSRA